MGDVTPNCFSKRWDPMFSTDRGFKEDWSRSWVDIKRAFQANFCDGLELFLRDYDASIPDIKIEELLEFAASFSLEDLKARVGSAGWRRGAWLDERSSPDCSISRTRDHKNPLTATQLYERVKTRVRQVFFLSHERALSLTELNQRIGNKDAPDANRRLV
jgi:hypothetical protein